VTEPIEPRPRASDRLLETLLWIAIALLVGYVAGIRGWTS
jgi:hypothetical protein